MAFERCLPQVYSADSVRRNAPAASGVYGISNAQHWLYVGESDNIQASLYAHLAVIQPNGDLKPSGYRFELCDAAGRRSRQTRLISELAPVCQQKLDPR